MFIVTLSSPLRNGAGYLAGLPVGPSSPRRPPASACKARRGPVYPRFPEKLAKSGFSRGASVGAERERYRRLRRRDVEGEGLEQAQVQLLAVMVLVGGRDVLAAV